MMLINVFRKEWKYFEIAFERYEEQFQIGFCFTRHKHFDFDDKDKYHGHFILDIGRYYLELTFGDSHYNEE
jgi:hypothetical protein